MTDLGDRIEGAQDDLWRVMSTTKSEISNIRGEVHEREERLYSEISDLEARLAALRQEETEAAQDRDSARKSLEKEERGIRAASRTELNGAQRAAEGDKKALSRERWELENKMQRAAVSATPAVEALADAQRQYKLPQISSLTEALAGMKRKMTSQVEGLQKQRVANEMIFEEKLKKIKNEQLIDLDLARSVAEGEISAEERALDNATSYFNSELEAKEKELLRTSNLAAGPVDYAGFGAIEEARNKLVALWENKQQAVANATEDRATAMASTVDKRQAIAQRYDAEYENALRNLQAQEARGERRLQQEDRRRERRGGQLQRELRDLTRKLSRLLREEEAEAEVKYKDIQREKTAVLADTVSRARRATNEIEMVRSELTMVQYERKNLETTLQQKERQLSELEEERTSFRKQARRTVAVALGRITRRGSGARGK